MKTGYIGFYHGEKKEGKFGEYTQVCLYTRKDKILLFNKPISKPCLKVRVETEQEDLFTEEKL